MNFFKTLKNAVLSPQAFLIAVVDLTSCQPSVHYIDGAAIEENRREFDKGNYEGLLDLPDDRRVKGYVLNALGLMYHFGYGGVTPDLNRAKAFYEKAAKYRRGEAANHLGRLYLNGEGVEKDEEKAAEWYKTSCDNRYIQGCENYAHLKMVKRK